MKVWSVLVAVNCNAYRLEVDVKGTLHFGSSYPTAEMMVYIDHTRNRCEGLHTDLILAVFVM